MRCWFAETIRQKGLKAGGDGKKRMRFRRWESGKVMDHGFIIYFIKKSRKKPHQHFVLFLWVSPVPYSSSQKKIHIFIYNDFVFKRKSL